MRVHKILINTCTVVQIIFGDHAEVYFFSPEIAAKPIKMASTSEEKLVYFGNELL